MRARASWAPWRGPRNPALLAAPLLALVTLTSCVGFSGPRGLERAFSEIDGAKVERVVGLSVSGGLVDRALRLAGNETGMKFEAGNVDRVQLGVYQLVSGGNAPLLDELQVDGLVPFVKVRDGCEEVRIFAGHSGGRLESLAIVVHDGADLVAMRISGDLGPLAAEAMSAALRRHAPRARHPTRLAKR